jgi:chromosome segregation ATPase
MSQQVTLSELVSKLTDSMTDLKISFGNVESKIDQLKDGLGKVEESVKSMQDITSSQETRIKLLEASVERIPRTLNEDLALMDSQLKNYQKFLWMVTGTVAAIIAKLVMSSFM